MNLWLIKALVRAAHAIALLGSSSVSRFEHSSALRPADDDPITLPMAAEMMH